MVKPSKISKTEKDSGWAMIRVSTKVKEQMMKELHKKQSFNSLLKTKLLGRKK